MSEHTKGAVEFTGGKIRIIGRGERAGKIADVALAFKNSDEYFANGKRLAATWNAFPDDFPTDTITPGLVKRICTLLGTIAHGILADEPEASSEERLAEAERLCRALLSELEP